jgi:RimJ/RimL family protein N-acetyltransferase
MKIRPARPEDRAFVTAAAQRLAAFGPPPWRRAEEIVAREAQVLASFFEAPAAGSALLIAESPEEERLGFAYLERSTDYFTLEEHGHISMLVATEAGKGVGGALLRAAEAWARERGYRKLTLTVFAGNESARAVYEHLGYAPETLRYLKVL